MRISDGVMLVGVTPGGVPMIPSGPPVPGRAGEVAFLQYLFMVLRVDLDARLQVGRRWGREG